MTIKSQIKVGNDGDLGFSAVDVETNCHGFVTIFIPMKDSGGVLRLELDRRELREFLARTMPAFTVSERYESSTIQQP